MNLTGFEQVNQGLRIAGFGTAFLLFLLASVILGFSSTVVLLGICGLTMAIFLPPAMPWIASRIRDLDLFSPYIAFPIAYILWFTLGSVNFIDAPPDLAFGYFDPIPFWMYGLYACGLAGYFYGLYAGRLLPVSRETPSGRELDMRKMQRILWITLLGFVVAWVFLALVFGVTLLHPDTANLDRLAHRGPVYQIFICLGWTCVMFVPIFAWTRGSTRRYDWSSVVVLPAVVSLLIVSLGAGRSPLVIPFLTLVIARSYFKKQPLWKLAVVGTVAFGVFSSLGYFRYMMSATSAPQVSLMERLGVPAQLAPVVDMSIDVRYSVAALRDLTRTVPASIPFQYGAISFLPLTSFLPGHRDMSDVVFKNMLGHDFEGSGEPATILAPLYVDFGWSGVFVGMSVYGLLLSWTYRRMKSRPTTVRIITYAWWLQNCLFGIFANGFINVYVFLLPIFWSFLFYLARSDAALSEAEIGAAALR